GETWTITINGVTFEYEVPDIGVAPENQSIETIAAALAGKVTGIPATTAAASGATITITADSAHAFTVEIKRGGDGVTGVFALHHATNVHDKDLVPVVLPWYQWLVDLYPWW